ncbi:MAG: Pyruvate:ferredoxin oxidoreductase alpha subunit PorA [Candidatus Methanohalarchaeum thermophilum]|uniref:Pyruvate synthase subunit PorA n=1 Tax=Methanohalarchaeum thermophilum TaxID=1903181 RepID=A0A1Q6DTC2_METT1|nr:MAG: Pyruvate:ferredoxin oxidoreductase alpha subunit PorA [Candidatus Methanohalarchaeum thermophilum]
MKRENREVMEGSHAVAHAVKNCSPDVIAAYPITPQTHIVEKLSQFVADGELKSEYLKVESEFSAMSACVGASATGTRTFTATSSQGLILMDEVLYNASGLRLPIVMVVANRAVGAPINIWNDHSDSMGVRDSGWIQLYAESNQEVLDMAIQSYKIAENDDVRLPAMVCMDGFILTHTYEPVSIPTKEEVSDFLPEFDPEHKLDPEDPKSFGTVGFPGDFMEFKYQQHEAMQNAKEVIPEVFKEYSEKMGREYNGLIEEYKTEDADVILISLGSVIGTLKDTVDDLRNEGEKVGLIKVRVFRPFPEKQLIDAIEGARAVGVLDKNISLGNKGALYSELLDSLYNSDITPLTINFIAGLGGRDIPESSAKKMYEKTKDVAERGYVEDEIKFVDLKEA